VSAKTYLGFDIGGTKVTAILSDIKGKITERKEVKTRKFLGPDELIKQIVTLSGKFEYYNEVGVVFPAPISYDGITLNAPNLTGWSNVNIREGLNSAFGKEVHVENDATAQTISVKMFDQGRKYRNFIYLVVGTGIGGGIFINNQIYRGARGYAGELGHMVILTNGPVCGCGRRGCVESLASGRSMTRRAIENVRELRNSTFLSNIPPDRLVVEDIFSGKSLGDPFCSLLVDEEIYYLSVAIANYINIFDPEAIFLGGGVMKNDPDFVESLSESVKHELGNYYRNVPILKVEDKTIDLAPVALSIYETTGK
jgi:glucokinase